MREVKVVLLPGDGIGPEVVGEARRLVDHVAKLDDIQVNWESHAVGGCANCDGCWLGVTPGHLTDERASDDARSPRHSGPAYGTPGPRRSRAEAGTGAT